MTPLAKSLTVALVLSIGVNVLLVGYSVGRRAALWPLGPGYADCRGGPGLGNGRRMGGRQGLGLGMQGRGGMGRPAVRAALVPEQAALAAQRDRIGMAQQSARAALGQTVWNRKQVEDALENLRNETRRAQELTHQAIVTAAEAAAPDARQRISEEFGPP